MTQANYGCFALEDIKKGEVIGEYIGKDIMPLSAAVPGKSQYLVELNHRKENK